MNLEDKTPADEFIFRVPPEEGSSAASIPIRHHDRATFIFDENGKHIATEGTGSWVWAKGMSVRDQFAAAALTALLSNPNRNPSLLIQDFASDAYCYADAMLAERMKPQQKGTQE